MRKIFFFNFAKFCCFAIPGGFLGEGGCFGGELGCDHILRAIKLFSTHWCVCEHGSDCCRGDQNVQFALTCTRQIDRYTYTYIYFHNFYLLSRLSACHKKHFDFAKRQNLTNLRKNIFFIFKNILYFLKKIVISRNGKI